MILYLVFDKKNHTCTPPAFAMDFNDAQQALLHMNPSNLDDLIIHEITQINSIYDFFNLTVDSSKSLPTYVIESQLHQERLALAREANEATQQAEGALDGYIP